VNEATLADLSTAVEDVATVTLRVYPDRTLTGTVHPHGTVPGLYVVRTGRRGRPAVFHEDDLAGVIFE